MATKRPRKKRAPTAKAGAKAPRSSSGAMDAAQIVLSELRSKHGKGSAMLLGQGGSLAEVTEVIPTGLDVLDQYVLGIGGLPVGRISEMYGPEGVGKSSLLLRCIAQAQRGGGLAVLAENENALQPEWAAKHGVDLDSLLIIEADTLEQTSQCLYDAIASLPTNLPGPSFFAWDTLAATPTKREIEEGLDGKDKMSERAKHLSKAMRLLTRAVPRARAHLMLVNQIRDNPGVLFGDKTTTPGGHAVKFHSSIRLQLLGGKAVKGAGTIVDDDDDSDIEHGGIATEHTGKDITVLGSKNKLSIPWRKARLRLSYYKGWDNEWSTLYHAKEANLVQTRAQGAKAIAEAYAKLGWTAPQIEEDEEPEL